jgi:hypothetical protein
MLLQLMPNMAADEHIIHRLLHTPKVPQHAAAQLVAAGVRITYAQLLDAANSVVEGVEVWVQAQQQQDTTTDIPPAAVAVCCGDCTVFSDSVSCIAVVQGCAWCGSFQHS